MIQFALLLSRTNNFMQIQTKLETILRNGIKVERILITLHVGREDNGTTFISNGSMQGNHWSLLAIDVENKSAYYGDSLGWPVPYNLISVLEENLHMLECKLGIKYSWLSARYYHHSPTSWW